MAFFPRFTWKYVCLRYEEEPGLESFAPRRGWLKVGEIFHNPIDSVMFRLLTSNVI